MKKRFTLILVSIASFAYAQVGINTISPQATFDVVGKPTDTTILDGVIAPRITGDQLAAKVYTPAQTGALVYVNSPASSLSGQVVNVTTSGYFYFDGSVWIALKPTASTAITNSISNPANTITSTVNGVSSSTSAVNTVANSISGNTLTTTVNGIAASPVTLPTPTTTHTMSSSGNTMTSVVNGITATAPAVNTVSNTISGNTLTTTVNGITGAPVNLPTSTTTNTLSTSGNTITSNVNGVTSSAAAVNTVANSISGNTITTTINGVAGSPTTVPNIYTANGTLTANRTVTEGANTLTFTGTAVGGTKFVNSAGTSTAQQSPIQIVDGGQANNMYLKSDANGNATWGRVNLNIIAGTFASTGIALPTTPSTAARPTGASITLPPGKWMIHLGSTVSTSTGTGVILTAGSIWVTFTVQDDNTGTTESTTLDHVTNYSGQRAAAGSIFTGGYKTFVSGAFAVNNTTGAAKTYYIWMQQERTNVTPTTATASSAFATGSWERYLYAVPML